MRSLFQIVTIGFCLMMSVDVNNVAATHSTVNETIRQIMFNRDGSHIAIATDQSLSVYDSNLVLMGSIVGDANNPFYIYTWHPDGQRILLRDGYYNAATLTRSSEQDEFAKFSPDGRLALKLATDVTGGYLIYDLFSRTLISRVGAGLYFEGLTLSYDGVYLAASGITQITVLDVLEPNQLVQIPVDGRTSTLVWNPISYQIAAYVIKTTYAGSVEQTTTRSIQIFDAATGSNIYRIDVPEDLTGTLYWTPDGQYLIGQRAFDAFLVWDTGTYRLVETFTTSAPIRTTAFSPYGGRLLYSSELSPTNGEDSVNLPDMYFPVLSSERLGEIINLCGLSSALAESLRIQAASNIEVFISQVNALSPREIPAGCKADLLAFATALQAIP